MHQVYQSIFSGEHKNICPPTEAQKKNKEKKCLETQQNDFSWRKYTFLVRVWTSTWLKCFDMTSRHWFTPHIPRILLFCKRNSAFFLTIVWLCGEGHKRSTSYQTTSLQTLNCECLQCVFSTDMKMSLFLCLYFIVTEQSKFYCRNPWYNSSNCMHNLLVKGKRGYKGGYLDCTSQYVISSLNVKDKTEIERK